MGIALARTSGSYHTYYIISLISAINMWAEFSVEGHGYLLSSKISKVCISILMLTKSCF